jgi:hypothetical protein
MYFGISCHKSESTNVSEEHNHIRVIQETNEKLVASTYSTDLSTLKLKAIFSPETSVDFWRTTRLYNLPLLWFSGQSSWLQTQGSRVLFPALPDFLRKIGSGTGFTQPREDNWGSTWIKSIGSRMEKPRLAAVRPRCANHATPLYPQNLSLICTRYKSWKSDISGPSPYSYRRELCLWRTSARAGLGRGLRNSRQ